MTADVHTAEQRSFNMARIRERDTNPEMLVRRLLHGAGFRYRLHVKGMPGRPDLVFAAARAVVFVHGCFWHMHQCRYGRVAPATNAAFWAGKRQGNRERDGRHRAALRKAGWRVFEVWSAGGSRRVGWSGELGKVMEFLAAARVRNSVRTSG